MRVPFCLPHSLPGSKPPPPPRRFLLRLAQQAPQRLLGGKRGKAREAEALLARTYWRTTCHQAKKPLWDLQGHRPSGSSGPDLQRSPRRRSDGETGWRCRPWAQSLPGSPRLPPQAFPEGDGRPQCALQGKGLVAGRLCWRAVSKGATPSSGSTRAPGHPAARQLPCSRGDPATGLPGDTPASQGRQEPEPSRGGERPPPVLFSHLNYLSAP